uniref:Uncharacterized protein n=1 Tax=Chaetoceros debilis TaxID=122233 RepID=A0A7S3Q5S8_9STRA
MTLSVEEYANREDSKLMVLIKSSKWDDVRSLLQTSEGKTMTSQPDVYDNLPLHFCLGYRAPDDIILSTLSLNRGAPRVHGTDYWLPLHIAAMWGSSSVVMEELIRAFPQALEDVGEAGIKGRTPRHFAGRFESNRELLERPTEEWIKIIEN